MALLRCGRFHTGLGWSRIQRIRFFGLSTARRRVIDSESVSPLPLIARAVVESHPLSRTTDRLRIRLQEWFALFCCLPPFVLETIKNWLVVHTPPPRILVWIRRDGAARRKKNTAVCIVSCMHGLEMSYVSLSFPGRVLQSPDRARRNASFSLSYLVFVPLYLFSFYLVCFLVGGSKLPVVR